MSNLEARLTELHDAAAAFETSGNHIRQALDNVNDIVDGILAMGYETGASMQFVLRYRAQRPAMDEWVNQILYFAHKLEGTADDIQQAASQLSYGRNPPLRGIFHEYATLHLTADSTPTPAPTLVTPPLGAYVSKANLPLYSDLVDKKQELRGVESQLQDLMRTRQQRVDTLQLLNDRLAAGEGADRQAIASLQTQITQMDVQIGGIQAHATQLHNQIGDLTTRLDRVRPGPGADIHLIASMEGGTTAQYIKDNTYSCVNYIANRMPIPDGMARTAYLWDNQAELYHQYGITRGNEPLVGSVIVLEREHSYANDVNGHLMYVEKVENGLVWITDNDHLTPVRLDTLTHELTGANITYLYFPWQTQG
jgi:CHAP domain-containing protein